MGKRIYPLNRIKYWYCYDIEDVCSLYKDSGLHPQTVRQWIKNGLPATDGSKPALIYGNQLMQYLGKLNQSNRCRTDFDQMFCCKCKDARHPYRKLIIIHKDGQSVKAKAHCQICKTVMNKNYKMDDVPRLRSLFRVGDVLELCDSKPSPVNTHIPAQGETHVNESMQWELFAYEA